MLRRAAQILIRRVGKIEPAHQVVGLIGHGGEAALVEVGRKRVVAGPGKTVGDAANLVVEAPPFLDHDDTRPALPGGREIALGLAAVGPGEFDHRAHAVASSSG